MINAYSWITFAIIRIHLCDWWWWIIQIFGWCSYTKNRASLSYYIHIRILPFSSIDIMFFNRFIIIHSSCKIYLANCPIRVWSLGIWMYKIIIVLKYISSYISWYLITMCNKFQKWWLNRYNARNKKHLIISFFFFGSLINIV